MTLTREETEIMSCWLYEVAHLKNAAKLFTSIAKPTVVHGYCQYYGFKTGYALMFESQNQTVVIVVSCERWMQ